MWLSKLAPIAVASLITISAGVSYYSGSISVEQYWTMLTFAVVMLK